MQQLHDVGSSPAQQPPPPDLVGVHDAALVLGVERTTVQRWARRGKLPVAVRMPGATGAVLFHREDVEALAAAEAAEPVERAS